MHYVCAMLHFRKDCPFKRSKNVLIVEKQVTREATSSEKAKEICKLTCWKQCYQILKKMKNSNTRKFVTVKMNNATVRFQLDTGSDIIIDEHLASLTWKKKLTKLQEEYLATN